MDTKEIQRLLDYIAKSPLAEVSIETEGLKISVKKHSSAAPIVQMAVAPAPITTVHAEEMAAPKAISISSTDHLYTVKSPMVGTFYRSAGPDKENFIEIGSMIEPCKTVCMIEAMKLFNEIDSEVSGKIVKILVENATPVEFDQPLFLVEIA